MKKKLLQSLAVVCLLAGLGQAQNGTNGTLTAQGADCTTVGACVLLKFDQSGAVGGASIALSGSFTATVQFEASNDGLPLTSTSKVWVAINGTPANGTTPVTSATTANTWQFNVAGYTDIRARASAWTSAPTVVIRSSTTSARSGGGAVYASGLGTSNVIPKGNGAGQLADSSITDDGTNVTTTDKIVVPVSAAAATPTISTVGAPTFGVYFNTTLMGVLGGAAAWVSVGNTAANTFQVPASGILGWSSSGTFGGAGSDTFIGRDAARVVRIGTAALAAPQANTLQVGESSRAATDTNVAGSAGTLRPGDGTGLGAGTKLCLQRNIMGVTGSAAQSQIDGYCVGPSKTLSNTSATAQSLVNISVPSNSAGGVEGTITITCTDGTNFDAETQSFNTSFVNKATVLTVTAPVITATSAANNSGSCTAGITAVAGTNSVDIKVTPVFTTIVPTTVTSYITLRNNGTGNATFN